ncbi:hypothetical protein [Clavibacter zhangzhiyongii]|uniref:Uncharacterized protein n=1 Tax=Clavibacter zhangzhiyongii TaxID=2768071 RepID=A0A7L7Z140_9MICO|nr:hypothetical protein [Clavibacter zhangzhiyongii]QOD43444.1 hypothetical protein H9X71_12760 [Clavibacter zhangzhiyongii]
MPPFPSSPPADPPALPALGPPGVVLLLSEPAGASAEAHAGEEERIDAAVAARAEARGALVRVRAGVHVERQAWEAVSARDRHLLRIRALARMSRAPIILGGASAAAVHGLPRLAPWPALVTLLEVAGAPPGRRAGTRVLRDPARGRSALVRTADGVLLPGLAATALAASHEAAMDAVRAAWNHGPGWYAHGLVALDHVLAPARASPVTRADLDAERALRGPGAWSRRAGILVEAADGGAACPVESVARGVAHEAGLAPPVVGAAADGQGRLALAWPRDRVGLRVRGAAGAAAAPRSGPSAGAASPGEVAHGSGRWRVVEVSERDVLAAGRLRTLLLAAGLEPERRAERRATPSGSRVGADPARGRSLRSPPLGCAGE